MRMLRKCTIILAGILIALILPGCSFFNDSIHIEWSSTGPRGLVATADRSRGIDAIPIGFEDSPSISMGFVATCRNSNNDAVAATWSVDDASIVRLYGDDGDYTGNSTPYVGCWCLRYGDCNLTAVSSTDSDTIRVRVLGNFEVPITIPSTIYCRLDSDSVAVVANLEDADIVLTANSLTSYSISCPSGQAKDYSEYQGYDWQYDFIEPSPSEFTQTDLPNNIVNFAFINSLGETVTATVVYAGYYMGYYVDFLYYIH